MALIRRASLGHDTLDTKTTVSKIRNACAISLRNSRDPYRFRVSLPVDDCVFDQNVAFDIMFINGRSILHYADRDTNFYAAAFL